MYSYSDVQMYNLCTIASERLETVIHDMRAMQWVTELLAGIKDTMPVDIRKQAARRLRKLAFRYTYRLLYKWGKRRSLLVQARVCCYLADLLQ